jgi:hypothetical protein
MAELAEAIAVVIADPSSSDADIRLGLQYRGFVAEQAEFALRRRNLPASPQVAGGGHSALARHDEMTR